MSERWSGNKPAIVGARAIDLEQDRRRVWVVVDTWNVPPGAQCPVLGRFITEGEGTRFIMTLPDYRDGRYGLDGPSE